MGGVSGIFAIPVISRIHEGVKMTTKDKRTLLDKMIDLLSILSVDESAYFVADAYYASKNIVTPLLKMGWHLVTRVKSNAVAYYPFGDDDTKVRRGRKRIYGDKVKLKDLLEQTDNMDEIASPVYGEAGIYLRYSCVDLLWRPVGRLVRFVFVVHPTRGKIILMSTDLELSSMDILKIYGFRFKIELSFKQILRIIGGYSYHFWMRSMKPTKKRSGDTYLHKESETYRNAVTRKLKAYHLHIQTGIIAQGLMMIIAIQYPQIVWGSFGSWMRTMNKEALPSEFVTAHALRNTLETFLHSSIICPILQKFIRDRRRISCEELEDVAA